MQRGSTGHYQITSVGGEQIRSFIPAPLPPSPPLEMSNARQRRLEHAILALGRLDSISLLLPDPNIFLYAYVRREAVLSSQIEGTQSSLTDLLLFELIDTLIQLGVVRELTGGRRNRMFAYDRYLAILNEGTEPL